MFDKGFFGGLFDFDGDGKLDTIEKAADFGMFVKMMEDSEESEDKEYDDEQKFKAKPVCYIAFVVSVAVYYYR